MPKVAKLTPIIHKFNEGSHAELWMISDPRTGREIGSYVLATRSARVGPVMHTRVTQGRVEKLFRDYLKSIPPDLARAGDGFLCQIG